MVKTSSLEKIGTLGNFILFRTKDTPLVYFFHNLGEVDSFDSDFYEISSLLAVRLIADDSFEPLSLD